MNREKWLSQYRKNKNAVWIRCKLTNGEEFNFDEFDGWKKIKEHCDKNQLFFLELYLQFRSNSKKIDLKNADGVYMIKSIKGQIGGVSTHYYTVGIINKDRVKKSMIMTPELVTEIEYEDSIENCFTETIIYDKTKKDREE